MLATFVIGLREGLEAALIVGIVAAFLKRRGRMDAVRLVWVGVAIAVAICVAGAVALQLFAASLPQAQQEGLETIVGAIAVVTVSYMIVWMHRHAREMKDELEAATASALARGSAAALVAMAFLAVLREGFETSVFLLAAFQASVDPLAAGFGAVAGLIVAAFAGYGIYRGGVRINLGRFFRLTGLVLVLIAAGLVASALHTAHEADWLNAGQSIVVDLGAVVRPGSVQSALLTGVLGLQPRVAFAEALGWLAYLVPASLYVAWPQTYNGARPTRPVDSAAVEKTPAPAVQA